MSEPTFLATGTLIQGRYRIQEAIGRGGMGAVYLAEDTRLSSQVALKQLIVTGNLVDRAFEREAKLLANLRHPALPLVSDFFSEQAGQFLVMQHIPGVDLLQLLQQRNAPITLEQALAWADHILGALEYLHGQNPPVVHRDIKPQNIKLTPRGELFLLDFGLARGAVTMHTRVTTGGSLVAYTPQYAPLEQIHGGTTDARSDLYALAATLYQLLTLVPPPSALDRAAALFQGQADPLRPLSERNPAVPNAINAILMWPLAIQSADRPQNARALREALRSARLPEPAALPATVVAASAPTMAAPHPIQQSPPQPEQHQPAWLWPSIGGLALLLLLGLVLGVFLLGQASESPNLAYATVTALPTKAINNQLSGPGQLASAAGQSTSQQALPTTTQRVEPSSIPPTATASAQPTSGQIAAQPLGGNSATARTVLLSDQFASTSSGWDPAYRSENGSNGYQQGGYHFSIQRTPDWLMWDVPRTSQVGNGVYTVEVTLLAGSGKFGFFLAYNGEPALPEQASFYRIVVHSNGQLERIEAQINGVKQDLALSQQADAPALLPNEPHQLSVTRANGELIVALDGVEIGRANELGLGHGWVGLFGESGSDPVSILYDNLSVQAID